MTVFRYKTEPLGRGKGIIKRPVADVSLRTISGDWIEFHPYIDSGADVTMIPLSLGKLLGFRLDASPVEQIGGIHGSVPVVYESDVMMKLGGDKFLIRIAWALTEEVLPLLGRTDIFDRFHITFRQRDGVILFESHPRS